MKTPSLLPESRRMGGYVSKADRLERAVPLLLLWGVLGLGALVLA